ncbi:HGL216Wp [Eremothecium sinecaudum]|uniref:tRNA-5-taurinomethyluridine 2-sulfurtransferase n=1 Tax=Eremothecium sinecaudum TaxID=45286 RepID=A0A0X8HV74_9SACH|nr:HGL216Wp [Eremothecium sinecaudum]AMD22124.1 HGL216Wp [Eremothecium sinecaudum]
MLKRFADICAKRSVDSYLKQSFPSKFDNVVVAMSSGVDSSLCAALYSSFPNVRGIYMQNWSQQADARSSEEKDTPCYERDWKDVQKVGAHLNIPVERTNFENDYWLDVFEPMLKQYESGFTPNPDVNCNRFVKFGALRTLLDKKYGKDNYWLVTGHYARILSHTDTLEPHLLRSYYAAKDQSYYLSQIDPTYLSRLLMPMGHLLKAEVRQWASELSLPTASKPDSQGICFVNQQGPFKNFLKEYLPANPGDIITVDELTHERKVWGKHDGLWSYTIGQKIGLSMPQGDPRYKGAWYVSDKSISRNELIIVRGQNNPALYKSALTVSEFIPLGHTEEVRDSMDDAVSKGNLYIQFRSLQRPIKVTRYDWQQSVIRLHLAEDQRAIAPGQFCTVYSGPRVLGSGPISP